MTLQIVQDAAADEVLSTSAFALLCGMLLQEQVPVDVAFSGPAKILDRFGSLDPALIEEAAPEDFAELCAADPAIHPYPDSMSVLIQALARFIVVNYDGDTAAVWQTAGSGGHLLSRLMLLPGFSKRKAQMFIALLGKQMGVRPQGWEQAAGMFAQPDVHRSVADVRDPESLEKVRSGRSRRQQERQETGRNKGNKSSHHEESKGSEHDMTDEEQTEQVEKAERIDARKARKAAKRAANKAARAGAPGEHLVDPDTGEPVERAGRRPGAKRAAVKARKSAKRAARRAARANDPDAPERNGEGRGGGRAAKKAAGGRQGRHQGAATDAAPVEGDADETASDAPTSGEVGSEDQASSGA